MLHWPGELWADSWSQKTGLGLFAARGSVVSQGEFASVNRIREPRAEEVVAEGAATLARACHSDTYFKVSWRRKQNVALKSQPRPWF